MVSSIDKISMSKLDASLQSLPSDIVVTIAKHVAGIAETRAGAKNVIAKDISDISALLRTCRRFLTLFDAHRETRIATFWSRIWDSFFPEPLQINYKLSLQGKDV